MRMRISYEKYTLSILTKNKSALLKEFRYLALRRGLMSIIRRPLGFYLGTPVIYFTFNLIGHSSSSSIANKLVNKIIAKIV